MLRRGQSRKDLEPALADCEIVKAAAEVAASELDDLHRPASVRLSLAKVRNPLNALSARRFDGDFGGGMGSAAYGNRARAAWPDLLRNDQRRLEAPVVAGLRAARELVANDDSTPPMHIATEAGLGYQLHVD